MKKISEEAKAEFVKDVDSAVSKCAIGMIAEVVNKLEIKK